MGFSYKIIPEQQWAEVTAEGRVDLSECVKAMEKLVEMDTFDPSFHVLVDLQNMKYSPSTGDAHSIVLTLRKLKSYYQGRIGIVVSGTFLFGMARMTGILAETAGIRMIPFKDYDSASQWVKNGNMKQN